MPGISELSYGHLDLAQAGNLLQARGYVLVDRFAHVHARKSAQELHICLVADLASMSPSRFLACLDEAIKQSVEHVLSYTSPMNDQAQSSGKK